MIRYSKHGFIKNKPYWNKTSVSSIAPPVGAVRRQKDVTSRLWAHVPCVILVSSLRNCGPGKTTIRVMQN